jgi:hypothetical protein
MERQYFYHIPELLAQLLGGTRIDRPNYLQWHVDARLRRYIHQRIPDDCSIEQVVEIARILVQEVQQLHGDSVDIVMPNFPNPSLMNCADLRGMISSVPI